MTNTEPRPKLELDHTIEGIRVHLKPVLMDDLDSLHQLLSDPINMKHLTFMTKPDMSLITKDAMVERVKRLNKKQSEQAALSFHVFLKGVDPEHSRFIGCAGLPEVEYVSNYGSVGIIVDKTVWSGGYATEILYLVLKYAFEDLHLHRLAFETLDTNDGMRGWLENVAKSKLESIQIDRLFDGDKYQSLCIYPLFAKDWYSTIKPSILNKLEKVLGKDNVKLIT